MTSYRSANKHPAKSPEELGIDRQWADEAVAVSGPVPDDERAHVERLVGRALLAAVYASAWVGHADVRHTVHGYDRNDHSWPPKTLEDAAREVVREALAGEIPGDICIRHPWVREHGQRLLGDALA